MCAPLRIADLLPYDGALPTGATATGPTPGALTTVYNNFFRASQIGVNGSNIAYVYDADGLLTGAHVNRGQTQCCSLNNPRSPILLNI
ncbi:MAG: hypothetical protein A2Z65_11785 [Gallionellales bacterium RIFCSPLOWO2_02_58_13]|nr:MAG: hypothetical protein A2Z65_11785 [Gallionellales bacterium RIFCSPLOWO2_02_58_13]